MKKNIKEQKFENPFKAVDIRKFLTPEALEIYEAIPDDCITKTPHRFGSILTKYENMGFIIETNDVKVEREYRRFMADAFNRCVKNSLITNGVFVSCAVMNLTSKGMWKRKMILLYPYVNNKIEEMNRILGVDIFFKEGDIPKTYKELKEQQTEYNNIKHSL